MKKNIWRNMVLCLGLSALAPVTAQAAPHAIPLRTQQVYIVKRGDTLWGIAGRFLVHPWQWPQIWHKNPYVKNPNLIYPGDRLVLHYGTNGQPELSLEPPHGSGSSIELQPKISIGPIPTVATGEVLPFLGAPGVIASKKAYERLPYLVAATATQPIYADGNILYTVGLEHAPVGACYRVVGLGSRLYQHGKHPSLGYVLKDLGEVKVIRSGAHAAVQIIHARREIRLGERLEPVHKASIPHYFPSAPGHRVSGHIIAQTSTEPELVVGQVVIIDQGREEGLRPGNILRIQRAGTKTHDTVTGKGFVLPPQRVGDLMIFRIFPKVSYAVITSATHGIEVGDEVVSPQTVAGAAK